APSASRWRTKSSQSSRRARGPPWSAERGCEDTCSSLKGRPGRARTIVAVVPVGGPGARSGLEYLPHWSNPMPLLLGLDLGTTTITALALDPADDQVAACVTAAN